VMQKDKLETSHWQVEVFATSFTLKPCTPHPTSYTPNPKTETLNPKPQILYAEPRIRFFEGRTPAARKATDSLASDKYWSIAQETRQESAPCLVPCPAIQARDGLCCSEWHGSASGPESQTI
jgi:hypothetical protein